MVIEIRWHKTRCEIGNPAERMLYAPCKLQYCEGQYKTTYVKGGEDIRAWEGTEWEDVPTVWAHRLKEGE